MIGEETKTKLREIVARYPSARSAMLPCLHEVQAAEGYVTPEGIAAVADALGVKKDEVESVVTFYSMYSQEPRGKYIVKVCTSISCYLCGCDDVLARLEQKLGIRQRETTADGLITLEPVECLAACGMGPVLQVNGTFVENLTPERAEALVDQLRQGLTPEQIRNEWRIIADGAGMKSETVIGNASTPEGAAAQQKKAR